MIFAELDANGWAVIVAAIGVVFVQITQMVLSYLTAAAARRHLDKQDEKLVVIEKSTDGLLTKSLETSHAAGKAVGMIEILKEQSSTIANATAIAAVAAGPQPVILLELLATYRSLWSGIVARGYIEAEGLGHIKRNGDDWTISPTARQVYVPIADDLRKLFIGERQRLNRVPTSDELTWAIDVKYRALLLENVCPTLGVTQHGGCLAIANIIAREAVQGID